MADRPEVIAHLTRLGLTTYEAKAYLALIRRDSYTAAQVARQAGLPRQRIYDVLGSLVEKGLASARPGDVVKYAATPPEVAIAHLLETHRHDLQSLERDALEMVALMTPAFEAGHLTLLRPGNGSPSISTPTIRRATPLALIRR